VREIVPVGDADPGDVLKLHLGVEIAARVPEGEIHRLFGAWIS
jgi:hypothetical protein